MQFQRATICRKWLLPRTVGYTGGVNPKPSYESVCSGDGHTEAGCFCLYIDMPRNMGAGIVLQLGTPFGVCVPLHRHFFSWTKDHQEDLLNPGVQQYQPRMKQLIAEPARCFQKAKDPTLDQQFRLILPPRIGRYLFLAFDRSQSFEHECYALQARGDVATYK